MGALARPPPFFCLPIQKKENLLVEINKTLVKHPVKTSLLPEELGPKEEREEENSHSLNRSLIHRQGREETCSRRAREHSNDLLDH